MGLDQDGVDQKIVRYFFPKALQWLDLVYGIPKEGEPLHWVALGKEWKEMYLLRRKTITSEVLFETSGTAGRSWKHHGLRFGLRHAIPPVVYKDWDLAINDAEKGVYHLEDHDSDNAELTRSEEEGYMLRSKLKAKLMPRRLPSAGPSNSMAQNHTQPGEALRAIELEPNSIDELSEEGFNEELESGGETYDVPLFIGSDSEDDDVFTSMSFPIPSLNLKRPRSLSESSESSRPSKRIHCEPLRDAGPSSSRAANSISAPVPSQALGSSPLMSNRKGFSAPPRPTRKFWSKGAKN